MHISGSRKPCLRDFPLAPSIGPYLLKMALNYGPPILKVAYSGVIMVYSDSELGAHTKGP